MELRQLAYLVAVAEERSFTRAAAREHVAQPGVSAQIRRLEEELGQTLFDRSGAGVMLTPTGEAVLPFARAALAGAAGVRDTIDEMAGLMRGRVAIGAMPSTVSFFANALGDFTAQHPRIEIALHERTSDLLLADLREGRLDLALVGLSGALAPGVSSDLIADEPLVAYVAPKHPLAGRTSVTMSELRDKPLISLPRGTGVRAALDSGSAAASIPLRIALEAGDPLVLAALASRGLGIAVLPRSTYDGVLPVALTKPNMRSRMELVWRTTGPTSAAARALLAHARAAIPQTREPPGVLLT